MRAMMYGVNLGGWLVLEKWITPSLFADTAAVDEYSLTALDDTAIRRRLKHHRQTFVTKRDFEWLAAHGVNAVRIPVGYWLFGDELAGVSYAPYQPAAAYLDQAFAWAEATGLVVVLSVHGAPGSQNGEAHSGRQGAVSWPDNAAYIDQTVQFVQKLAERYGASSALAGIGVLNEPAKRLPPKLLRQYYRRAYKAIRQACPQRTGNQAIAMVITDIYHPRRWTWWFHRPWYRRVYIDTHQYQLFKDWQKRMDVGSHLIWTATWVRAMLGWWRLSHRLIVGEWSATLDKRSLEGVAPADVPAAYQAYARVQQRAYRSAAGIFYWNYKTEGDLYDPWNFRVMHERRVIEDRARVQ